MSCFRVSALLILCTLLALGGCATQPVNAPLASADINRRADSYAARGDCRSLDIAPETVKSHVKNIFDKLSVEKRAQAIARAQSLGLLRTV